MKQTLLRLSLILAVILLFSLLTPVVFVQNDLKDAFSATASIPLIVRCKNRAENALSAIVQWEAPFSSCSSFDLQVKYHPHIHFLLTMGHVPCRPLAVVSAHLLYRGPPSFPV